MKAAPHHAPFHPQVVGQRHAAGASQVGDNLQDYGSVDSAGLYTIILLSQPATVSGMVQGFGFYARSGEKLLLGTYRKV